MPNYSFECKKCKHAFDLFLGMNDKKEGTCPECKSKKTQRVWTVPTASIDAKTNPFDLDALTKKTQKGTIGGLWQIAEEASQARAAKSPGGVDPIKAKALKDYAKQRNGAKYKAPIKDKSIDIRFGNT